MSDKFVGGLRLPPISAEFIATIERAFPAPTVEVGFDRDKLIWAAAQYEVVKWIKLKAHVTQTTADANSPDAQKARVRYGS